MSLLFVCAGKVIKKGGILKSAAFCILTRLTLLLLPFLADASNSVWGRKLNCGDSRNTSLCSNNLLKLGINRADFELIDKGDQRDR
jgi:hypothetical protein